MSDSETVASAQTGSAGLLSATYHFMMSRVMDKLAQAGHDDLSKTQLHVLARFGEQDMTLEWLSNRVQIPVQVVANIAGMLAASGYIEEVSKGALLGDSSYRVTQRGYEALRIVSESEHAVEKEWVQELGNDAFEGIITSLQQLFQVTMTANRHQSR